MSIVKIENVRVLDPIQKTDSVQTVYLQDGKLIAQSIRLNKLLMVRVNG